MAFLTIGCMGLIFSITGILFPTKVCALFMNMDANMNIIAQKGVRKYFAAFFPMGINLLASYYLQSILSVKKSLCISLLRNVILSSVAIITFPIIFGGDSLWIVMPVVEVLVVILSITFIGFKHQNVSE